MNESKKLVVHLDSPRKLQAGCYKELEGFLENRSLNGTFLQQLGIIIINLDDLTCDSCLSQSLISRRSIAYVYNPQTYEQLYKKL